jgi:hypothetical protein
MKKFFVAITIMIYSFLSINLLFAATFTQADLTGTWRMNLLRTGYESNGTTPRDEWVRGRVTIDSSGVVSCLSYSDSTGETTCPGTFDLTFTMNETTGVITQSGYNAANAGTDHMTMSLNKNFAAGTATNGSGPGLGYSYQLVIVQKEVPGTTYSATDLENKSFVYHQLEVGDDSGWSYGAGTINAIGLVTISSTTNSWGSGTPGPVGIMLVDGNGVVTQDNDESFQGFLSDDKKTFVATNNGGGSPELLIVQITGQTYTAGTLHASTSAIHTLGRGSSGSSAFWIHYTNTVDNSGVMNFSEWEASNAGITPPGTTPTGSIDASGTLTVDTNPTYHGQASDDKTFTVATQTRGTSYMLNVGIKSASDMILYGRFTGGGIWKWDGSVWSQVTPNDPTDIEASGRKLYGNFGTGAGIWMYDEDSSIWSQITPNSPTDMVASGPLLYGNFGAGAGIWKWDGTTWSQITPNSPTSMTASHRKVYGNFGTGAGIWMYDEDSSTWSQITPNTPTSMTASSSLLYGNFSPGGIWQWNGTAWSQITPNSPTSMRASSWLLYGNFGTGAGIWKWDGTAWSQVTPNHPQHNMVCMYQELFADFSGGGIWKWDGSVWSQVTPNDPASMVTGY